MSSTVAAPWPAPTSAARRPRRIRVPGSKSVTNRVLVLAALAAGPSVIRGGLRSRDTDLMCQALKNLGVGLHDGGAGWEVSPADLRGPAHIDCGLAGTVMRFVPPMAALARGDVVLDGDPRARLRPMSAMIHALRALGIDVDDDGAGSLPFTVRGTGSVRGGVVELDASASSQFVSGLLLSAARFDEGADIRHTGDALPSLPHVAMTVDLLRRQGIEVLEPEPHRWVVRPGVVRPLDVDVEPDLSNAAPFLAAGLVLGAPVTVEGWPTRTTQPGDRLRTLLADMGGEVALGPDGLTVARSGPLTGIDVDLGDVGELTPVLAAVAALAETPSTFRGIAHIRGHETDRLAALATELTRLGGRVRELDDGLHIEPAPLHGGAFRTYDDHRMAHAAVVLGLAVPGILVENIGTTGKTYPGFAGTWARFVGG